MTANTATKAATNLQGHFAKADHLLADLRALGPDLCPGFVHYKPDSNSWGISLGSRDRGGEGLYADLDTLRVLRGRVRSADSGTDQKIKVVVQEALVQIDRWDEYVRSNEYTPSRRPR